MQWRLPDCCLDWQECGRCCRGLWGRRWGGSSFYLRFLQAKEFSAFIWRQFALALGLAGTSDLLLLLMAAKPARFVTLAVPVVAALALAHTPGLRAAPIPLRTTLPELAAWAESSTWGSSVFLFADAGRAAYPGVFRAQSRHGLWVDWRSARGVVFSETAAARWQERWASTMENGFSAAGLEKMLPLPIDYYVLRTEDQLDGPRRSFRTKDFVVYDAEDLRNATKPLRVERRVY